MTLQEILAFADDVGTVPAYTTAEIEHIGERLVSHRKGRPLCPHVLLVGADRRDIIVKALRFYAKNYM